MAFNPLPIPVPWATSGQSFGPVKPTTVKLTGGGGGGSKAKPGGTVGDGSGALLRQRTPQAGTPSFMKKGSQPGTNWDAFIADLLGQYADGGGSGGGGSYGGGGGGGGVDISGILAAARAKYDESNGKLSDLYGDLAKTYEPLPDQTKTRYNQAIDANNTEASRIVAENRARADKEAVTQAAAAAKLGIADQPAGPTEANRENEYANSQLQLQAQNWGGLMGAGREAQVGRDVANLQGARDAGVVAQEELRKQYEAYIANLQAQAASSGGGGGGGGGGYGGGGSSSGGSKTGNKLLDKMNEAMLVYALGQKGIYANQWAYSAYKKPTPTGAEALGISSSAYNRAAAAYAANGTNAAAKTIQGGQSPQVVAALRKQFG